MSVSVQGLRLYCRSVKNWLRGFDISYQTQYQGKCCILEEGFLGLESMGHKDYDYSLTNGLFEKILPPHYFMREMGSIGRYRGGI